VVLNLGAFLAATLLAADPAPAPSAAPAAASAAPAAQPTPAQTQPAAAPPPAAAAAPSAAPPAAPEDPKVVAARVYREMWRVEVDVPDKEGAAPQAHVMTWFGRLISLREGMDDAGQSKTLEDRARQQQKLEGGLDAAAVQRAVVFAMAGLLGGGGVVGLVSGAVVMAMGFFLKEFPPALRWFTELPRMGPVLALGGVLMLGVAIAALVVGGVLTALLVARPPPPAATVLDTVGSSVDWTQQEAMEVVKVHNQKVLDKAGLKEPPLGLPLVPVRNPPVAPPEKEVEEPGPEPAATADKPTQKMPGKARGKKAKKKK